MTSINQDHHFWSSSMKMEPDLDISLEDFNEDNFWLFDDDDMIIKHDIYSSVPLSAIQQDIPSGQTSPDYITESIYADSLDQDQDEQLVKPSRAELANKLLIKLEEPKQEPFTDWLEEKIDLPVFEDYNQAREPQSTRDTQSLLLEFESVCGFVGVNQYNHLTPPQSPPQTNAAVPVPVAVQPRQQTPEYSPDILHLDVAKELAAFDQLVNDRAQVFTDAVPIPPPSRDYEYANNHTDLIEPDSPKSSSSSSYASSAYGSSELDEDWSGNETSNRSRVRSKPYSRGVDDKRSRKKEQNKNAATRYRQKKKAEVEILAEEEKGLEDKNADLKSKVNDLNWEVKYLRGLMKEICKAKGLIKH